MYDKDSLKQQAFLRFSDITKKKAEPKESSSDEGKAQEGKSSKAEMESKLATARMHANKEMDSFRKITEQYVKDIKGLVLFQGIDDIIDELMLDQLLGSIIAPLIKGHQIPGMSDEQYRDFRTNMYKTLIHKYVDSK